jgi:selenocysteine lyase/cysteine desulfurase
MPILSKRQFLKNITVLSVLSMINLDELLAKHTSNSPADLAKNEDFWLQIRKAYHVTEDFIQLENGYYSLASEEVLEAYIKNIRTINKVSSYYMRTRQFEDKLLSRKQLAELLGCSSDELIITRNTTESLDTIIAGINWKEGDEAVMAEQDYGAMLDSKSSKK